MIATRTRSRAPRATAAALLAAAALLLAGCGTAPAPVPTASQAPAESGGAGGQSQAQQCAQVMAEVQAIATDVGRVGELLAANPLQALALLADVSGRVGDLQTSVSDPALLERIGEIQAGWEALLAEAESSLAAGDPAGVERVTAGVTELLEQVSSLQEFCAGTA